jgi:hypothetical protein
MKLPYGMFPRQFEDYIQACYAAKVDPDRISQTIGSAPASKGYHAKDGIIINGGKPYAFCAATDLDTSGLSVKQIKTLLYHLAENDFVGWYRYLRPFHTNRHIHIVYASVYMKPQLQRQVVSYLNSRDGLAGNLIERFYTAPTELDEEIKKVFLYFNPQAKDYFK